METTTALGAATWTDIEATPPSTLLVPLGSTEQHGPHLPLDTDTRIAVALCEAAAKGHPQRKVAPPLAYGSSGEHQAFPGTVSIGTEALALVLVELARSALLHVDDLVFVNGHGGNVAGLRQAIATLHDEGRMVGAWGPHATGADAHAGHFETSLMLAIAPETVRTDHLAAGNTTPIAELMAHLQTEGVRPLSATGILGDATGADTATGAAVFAAQVEALDSYLQGR